MILCSQISILLTIQIFLENVIFCLAPSLRGMNTSSRTEQQLASTNLYEPLIMSEEGDDIPYSLDSTEERALVRKIDLRLL